MTTERRYDYGKVKRGEDGLFYGQVFAPNGEQIFSTEGHANRGDVIDLLNGRGFPVLEDEPVE